MCGRYVAPDQAAIERAWHIGRHNINPFKRRFNVQPTTQVPILHRDPESGELELTLARWGLIPQWWKETKPPRLTFNARSEEAAAKPMWLSPMRHARCLIPAEGWYEWQEVIHVDEGTGEAKLIKQPHFIYRPDKKLLCFAALMSLWTPPGQNVPAPTCAILTRASSGKAADVHDRMPVILPDSAHGTWLDPALDDSAKVNTIIREQAVTEFEHYPVSTRLNSARTDEAKFIERATSV